ncbi:MAG TPA: hypothetical protein PLO51_02470, partial [Candidatus Micrarchaeota archaeon]|nr:hypothetical protein [Candidatus Micrarchaeota archaeon]
MELNLHQLEKKLLPALSEKETGIKDAAQKAGMGMDEANRAAAWLEEKGLAKITRESRASYSLTEEGRKYIETGLPEQLVLAKAEKGVKISDLSPAEKSIGISWARKLGWVAIGQGMVKAQSPNAKSDYPAFAALKSIADGKAGAAHEESIATLVSRGLALKSEQKDMRISITEKGEKIAKAGIPAAPDEINVLDRNTIVTGAWKTLPMRKYDISQEVEAEPVGKRHMVMAFRERIRSIFAQMGFEEMEGSIVESSFCNFDAL